MEKHRDVVHMDVKGERRWTPTRAVAQDTGISANSLRTHLMRKYGDTGHQRAVVSRIYNPQNINKIVSQAALKKLQNHMWYLGSEMAPLSLFSSRVSDDEKKAIVEAMNLSGDGCNLS